MTGKMFMNVFAATKLMSMAVGSPQYNRPSYRGDDFGYGGGYRIFGFLQGSYDPVDSRSRDYSGWGFRRSFEYRGETCPYDNEKLLRKKRSIEGKSISKRSDGLVYSRYRSQLEEDRDYMRFRGRNYYDRDDRYRWEGGYDYDRRWRNGYGYDRDRFGAERRYDYGPRARTYPCGREICSWDAELECSLDDGYGRLVWRREHDAYYARGQYRDLQDYCGSRCSMEGRVLRIREVRPEDKGVYRCYIDDGTEQQFQEVKFYPKYPLSSNDEC